jgi:hypothetical protein
MQTADHRPVLCVERCEQAGGAVAQVVVSALLGHAGHHRERRLGARQRLHLTLFIHAVHDRGLGRVDIQADHVIHLLHKQRIGRQLERVGAVRLDLKGPPDPTDRRLRQTAALGHRRMSQHSRSDFLYRLSRSSWHGGSLPTIDIPRSAKGECRWLSVTGGHRERFEPSLGGREKSRAVARRGEQCIHLVCRKRAAKQVALSLVAAVFAN